MFPSTPLFSIFDGIDTTALAKWAARIVAVIGVWIIVFILVRYLSRWLERVGEESEHVDINRRDIKTIDRLLDYVIILVGIIISLGIMGWTNLLLSALTAAGVFSIIIGFGVKDVAANFISGIFILVDQPFVPEDFIEVAGFSGTVRNISLRSTTLVTVDGPIIYIPNSVIAVQPTTNYSLAKDRRINFTVSIANDADVSQAIQVINAVLQNEEGLLADLTQLVLVNDVREYAVDISVICHAPPDTFFTLTSDLKQQVMTALQEHNIELAVPVRKNVYPDLSLFQAQLGEEKKSRRF